MIFFAGELFPSAESLVEHLLSLGISQSYIGSGARTNGTASASNAPSAASSSANLASPSFASCLDASLSSATVPSPVSRGVSPSSETETSTAASASPMATTQSHASTSVGDETELRAAVGRNEETSIPHSEGAKKGSFQYILFSVITFMI